MNDLPIYLDHNATTPVASEVRDAILPWLASHGASGFGNPSSAHRFGRLARAAFEKARAQVASLIGAEPDEIIFTGSGTEADNMAMFGIGPEPPATGRVLHSAVEHPGVAEPAKVLKRRGWRVDILPVDDQGRVDLGAAERLLREPADLISVMLAHNETGVVQPVAEIVDRARAAGAVVHTDAAQAVGKIHVDVGELGVDSLTIVGHKFYAPKGVAALYCRKGTRLRPLMVGGGQEQGRRPGTENVALVVGLGAAAQLAKANLEAEAHRQRELVEHLQARLRTSVPGLLRTVDPERGRVLPNTLHLQFPDCDAAALLAACPGVAASRGSACHTDDHGPPGVLQVMGRDIDHARGAVRLSLGRSTTEEDVVTAAAALAAAWQATRL